MREALTFTLEPRAERSPPAYGPVLRRDNEHVLTGGEAVLSMWMSAKTVKS